MPHTPASLANKVYPVTAPGLPTLHADLIEHANNIGCSYEAIVSGILRSSGNFYVQLSTNKAKVKESFVTVGGHLWGDRKIRGPQKADIMIVGKCLSYSDVNEQRHFAGDVGIIMRDAMQAAHFSLDEMKKIYITTLLKTPPLAADKTTLAALWIEQQMHLLIQEILLVRPKLIIAQGSEAVKALLGRTTLAATEQTVQYRNFDARCSEEDPEKILTIPIVCTMHPAAIIYSKSRNSGDKYASTNEERRLSNQLKFIKQVVDAGYTMPQESVSDVVSGNPAVEGTMLTSGQLAYYIVDTSAQLEHHLKRMQAEAVGKVVAWDGEWQGQHPQDHGSYFRCIQFSYKKNTAVVIALTRPGGAPRFDNGDPNGAKTAAKLCKKYMAGMRPAGHFFNADLHWFTYYGLDIRKEFAAASSPEAAKAGEGGLAIELAAHAVDETARFGLDAQLSANTNLPAYYVKFDAQKKAEKTAKINAVSKAAAKVRQLAKLQKLIASSPNSRRVKQIDAVKVEQERAQAEVELQVAKLNRDATSNGYGWISDEALYEYGAWDAAAELELADYYFNFTGTNKAALDNDRFGLSSWRAYWISHQAAAAVLEINCTGMYVDRDRVDQLALLYTEVKEKLLEQLRQLFKWPDFNPDNRFQFAEALFGEKYNGYYKQYGTPKRFRPPGAKTIRAMPLRTSGKYPIAWDQVIAANAENKYTPSAGKQTLNEMLHLKENLVVRVRQGNKYVIATKDFSPILRKLIDYRYMSKATSSLIRSPVVDDNGDYVLDDDGRYTYTAGVIAHTSPDNFCRTSITQTAETGRWKSRNPNLQNVGGKEREADYKRILKKKYPGPVRAIFTAPRGWFLVEADYSGAELMMAAVMSGDSVMLDHCQRARLSEDDPDYVDIHASTTVRAFQLDCPPTKHGLDSIDKGYLRNAAKAIVFGMLYGQSPPACATLLRQKGTFIDADQAIAIQQSLFQQYPDLKPFLQECAARPANPGYLVNMFGRIRRFSYSNEREMLAKMGREAMNAPFQGGVADAVSLAIANIYRMRNELKLRSRICLQVHDAIMLYVPADELMLVMDQDRGLLKTCMVDQVPLRLVDLDGNLRNSHQVYHFGYSSDVYKNWGVIPLPNEFIDYDLDPAIAGWTCNNTQYFHEKYKNKVWQNGQLIDLVV